jgi:hypothetical protein
MVEDRWPNISTNYKPTGRRIRIRPKRPVEAINSLTGEDKKKNNKRKTSRNVEKCTTVWNTKNF